MDAEEHALLAETVTAALDQSPDTDAVLTELGWYDMLDAGPDVVMVVFEALGRANANATTLDDVIVHALGLPARSEVAVLLPPFGTSNAPTTAGLATGRVRTATTLLVVRGERACMLGIDAADIEPIKGIDPRAALHRVRIGIDGTGASTPIGIDAWSSAVALAQRAIAHEILGATRAMLELAREHTLERNQFGRPIARFQAVRHRLAETLVAIESLEAALAAAADVPIPETARLAKAAAGNTARTVAAHCQQVLAGVGFTTDHHFHRQLKRTILLEGLFGSSDELVLALGREILAARAVPMYIDL